MVVKSNPTKKFGFSYFFRNKRKSLFIRKPGGRKYYKFDVPSRVDPISFLEAVFQELLTKEIFDYKYYFTKNGELTNRRTSADAIWIKTPRGKKFKQSKLPRKLKSAAEADEVVKFLIQEHQKKARTKARKKREKELEREEIEIEEEITPKTESKIEYTFEEDKGFYKSKEYGITRYEMIKAYAIPQVKITKHNVDSFIEYIGTFGMTFVHEILKEMRVKEGQMWRLRVMGGGVYERHYMRKGKIVKKVPDTFGFSLEREEYNESTFEVFSEDFTDKLRDKLTGAKSYLTRAVDGFLTFEGFHVETYK